MEKATEITLKQFEQIQQDPKKVIYSKNIFGYFKDKVNNKIEKGEQGVLNLKDYYFLKNHLTLLKALDPIEIKIEGKKSKFFILTKK